jgi:ATP-binding cassette subfamily F protein uup
VIEVISEISEKIPVGDGQQMSAAQFLRYFQFPNEMHYTYVHKLSGGERKRLHLMTVLMRNPNFLILDEPTNDLDIFTLNVLEDYLKSFKGCVIIVSHDRFFVDKVVDHVFVFTGNGNIKDFPGNYSDYQQNKQEAQKNEQKLQVAEKPAVARVKASVRKLSFKEKREMEQLEAEIEALETEKAQLEQDLSSGTLSADDITVKANRMGALLAELEVKELRWLDLSEIEG